MTEAESEYKNTGGIKPRNEKKRRDKECVICK
jgi:hypothetical protein